MKGMELEESLHQCEDLKEQVAVTDHHNILLDPELEKLQTVIEQIGQMCKASWNPLRVNILRAQMRNKASTQIPHREIIKPILISLSTDG